ncbi:DNA double-strand break repair nuclease NurA [Halorussus ruber]|uniref:DNA double-strand break repair nuclease NurA n=1 Tax=Halorussus ruber TaxID=1126238 RepID=UPI001091C072|nr:DNA double-strand break repair nuclease NurA [Halorussus ruber]
MDERTLSVVNDLVGRVDEELTRDTDDQTANARELFELLSLDGGSVEPFESVEYLKTPTAELGTWEDDPWGDPTYGVDASTTRPMEYDNGLIVDVAHAKLGVNGASADRSVERRGTVVTGLYSGSRNLTVPSTETNDTDIIGEVIQVPDSRVQRNVTSTLTSAVQRRAEARHAKRCLDAVDGPLFLDGSVYPLGLLPRIPDSDGDGSLDPEWELPTEVVRTYVDIVDDCFERDVPVYGVVKTSEIDTLIEALRRKIERNEVRTDDGRRRRVPYRTDAQFIASVLRNDSLEHLAYTTWFVETTPNYPSDRSERLDPLAAHLDHGTPADYRRAFCHIRLPETGNVFRIETPLLFLERGAGPEALRLKALREIARRCDVPGAVARADRIARISPKNRNHIRNRLEKAEPSYDYNDGRWGYLHNRKEGE